MKTFLFVISLFIGLLAYNIYTPTEQQIRIKEFGGSNLRSDELIYLRNLQSKNRTEGFFVGLFFMVVSGVGMFSLYKHLEDKKSKN